MKKALLTIMIALASTGLFAQTGLTTAVDFTVTDIHGNTHNLFDILASGQHVLIDFFFVDCGTCQAYQAQVNQVYADYGCNEGDLFIMSVDQGDSDAYVQTYEDDYNGQHPSIGGNEGGGNAVASAYGITAYPTVILIAPNHDVVVQDIWPPTTANLNSSMSSNGVSQQSCNSNTGIEDLANADFTGIAETYPNPASDESTIAFGLVSNSEVSFEVYNLLGSKVAQISKAEYDAGANKVDLPVYDLSSGNYFINMIVNDTRVNVKKISVIK